MTKGRSILTHIGVFLLAAAILWLMLIAAAALPNSAIADNMERSALSYSQKDAFSVGSSGRLSTVQDNYADAIMVNVSWFMGSDDPLTGSLDTGYYDGGEYGENFGLYMAVTGQAQANTDYTRYWHGTAVFIRLLHLVTDVEGIKTIGCCVIFALFALTVCMLLGRRHGCLALCLTLAFLMVRPWNLRLSMEYQPAFLLSFLLCPAYLAAERKSDLWLSLLAVIGGVMTGCFDFLTTETVVLLPPLMLVVAVRAREGRLAPFRETAMLLLRCYLCWLAAYGGMFLLKWTLASLVTGENTFLLAISSAGERVSGDVSGEALESLWARIPGAVLANLSTLFGSRARIEPLRALGGAALTGLVLFSLYYLFRAKRGGRTGTAALWLLGSVVFLRYMVLSNHSYLHTFFTYRALVCPLFAAFASVALNTALPKKKRGGRR